MFLLPRMQINGQLLYNLFLGLTELSLLWWNLAWCPQECLFFRVPTALGMLCHNYHLVPFFLSVLQSDLFFWRQKLSFVYNCRSCSNSAYHRHSITLWRMKEWIKTIVSEKSNSIARFKEHFLASLRDITRQYMINCWMNHAPVIAIEIRGGILYIFVYPPEHLSQWLAHSGNSVNTLWMNNHCFWIKWWWAIEEQAVKCWIKMDEQFLA